MSNKKILTVGAYERDNFGDYLFYYVLLMASNGKYDITPGSLIDQDMSDNFNLITTSYRKELSQTKYDVVWVVGGEVGGVDIHSALSMSLRGFARDIYTTSKKNGSLVNLVNNIFEQPIDTGEDLAYIPDLSMFPLNKDTPLIINSCGISKIHSNKIHLLKNANLTVRDRASADFCRSNKVDHKLIADVVHTIPKYYQPKKIKSDYILIQMSEGYVSKNGYETVLNSVSDLLNNTTLPIKFIAAGVAEGHDNIQLYNRLARDLQSNRVSVVSDRKPLKIVDYIASAKAVIATSLHFRIIASSYGIGRISLENEKVSEYVALWDKDYPYNISLNNIVSSVGECLNTTSTPRTDLMKAAQDNLDSLLKTVDDLPKSKHPNTTANIAYSKQSIHIRNTAFTNLGELLKTQKDDVENLKKDLSELQTDYLEVKGDYEHIVASRSWRILTRARKIKALLSRQ